MSRRIALQVYVKPLPIMNGKLLFGHPVIMHASTPNIFKIGNNIGMYLIPCITNINDVNVTKHHISTGG